MQSHRHGRHARTGARDSARGAATGQRRATFARAARGMVIPAIVAGGVAGLAAPAYAASPGTHPGAGGGQLTVVTDPAGIPLVLKLPWMY